MLKNYLIIALRNLRRNRSYTILNVAGLALGMACSLILLLIIDFELSFDNYHSNKERIYRTTQHLTVSDGTQTYSSAQYPMGEALRNDFPDLEAVSMVEYRNSVRISSKNVDGNLRDFTDHQSLAFVEPSFLEIFDFQPLHGDLVEALKSGSSLVITATRARRYFGLGEGQEDQAIGRDLLIDGKINLTVGAVIEDIPANTDYPFSLMAPFRSLKGNNRYYDEFNWDSSHMELNCYFLSGPGFNLAEFERQLIPFMEKYRGEGSSQLRRFICQPLSDIHFNDQYSNYTYRTVSVDRLWVMGLIALVLIVTAAINFINLASAQAGKQAREVSIRKIMGSSRSQLIFQFFSENFGVTLLAMLVALVLAELMIVNFEDFINLGENFDLFTSAAVYKYLLLIGGFVGLLSGIYPAITIANMKTLGGIRTLDGSNMKGLNARKVLVTGQFVITQVLIIGTLIVRAQLDYFNNKPLNFESDSHVVFNLPDNSEQKLQLLRNELSSVPGLSSLSLTLGPPQTDSYFETTYGIGDGPQSHEFRTEVKPADSEFFETFGLKFAAGEAYRADDSTSVVINQAMMKVQGYDNPVDIIGKKISVLDSKRPVCGVVEDFHSRSLHMDIAPLVITSLPHFYYEGVVKVNLAQGTKGDLSEVMSLIENSWEASFPGEVFSGYFLDEYLAGQYEQEEKTASLVMTFTLIAIMIGAMGLYGLVSFYAAKKIKEVGIRKVLGAGVLSIVKLFSVNFFKLMLFAFIVAAPVGYLVLSEWLNSFAYRININIFHFLLAILFSGVITFLAIGYHSIRAAMANPVESLRNE